MSIPLSPSGDTTCPVIALRTLVERYPRPTTAPLFSRLIGPFDRKWVLSKLKQALLFAGINPAGFSGHSFRRGAANSALKAGISREDIMKMGRWKSHSVDRYFSPTTENRLLFSLCHERISATCPTQGPKGKGDLVIHDTRARSTIWEHDPCPEDRYRSSCKHSPPPS